MSSSDRAPLSRRGSFSGWAIAGTSCRAPAGLHMSTGDTTGVRGLRLDEGDPGRNFSSFRHPDLAGPYFDSTAGNGSDQACRHHLGGPCIFLDARSQFGRLSGLGTRQIGRHVRGG